MRRPHRAAGTLLVAFLAASGSGRAQPDNATTTDVSSQPTRVLLLASDDQQPLVARVAAELRSLRFEVILATAESSAPSGPELEELARRSGARVAVQVAASEGSIDLWLVSPDTHEVVYRRIVSDQDPAVAAFRSLEVLRGSLIDLQALAPDPVPEAPKSEPLAAEPPKRGPPLPRSRPFSFLLGGAIAAPFGHSTASWYALASVGGRLSEHWSLNGFALAPVSSSTIRGEGGYALVGSGFLGGGVSVRPLKSRVLVPALGVGVAGAMLQTRGVPQAGFSGTSQLNFAAFPHARLDLSAALGSSLRARAELMGGGLMPRPVLLFAGQRTGFWGSSLLIAGLGLELVFG